MLQIFEYFKYSHSDSVHYYCYCRITARYVLFAVAVATAAADDDDDDNDDNEEEEEEEEKEEQGEEEDGEEYEEEDEEEEENFSLIRLVFDCFNSCE